MARPPLERRVSILEEKVEHLEKLPARMDAIELQIVQLRTEMRGEFSTVRQEIVAGDTELRKEMHAGFESLRKEFEPLRKEIVAGDQETRRFMRVLYEDLVERIATIGSATPPRRPKR
jgi:uncharacterized protein YPO0396